MTHDQTLLDHLYWQTKTTMKDIAAQVGLKPTEVKKFVTPQPAGVDCIVCRVPCVERTRDEVNRSQTRCPQCGMHRSRTPSWVDRTGRPLSCDGVVVLLEQTHTTSIYGRGPSFSDTSCVVGALHAAGFGWDETRLVVSCSYPPYTPGLIDELVALEAKVVAMESPDLLVLNHREFPPAVARLTEAGCRVICAREQPGHSRRAVWYGDVLGELADPDNGLPFTLVRRPSSSSHHGW